MSRATKRKHVLLEMFMDDFSPPTEDQQIVRVVASRGNNLHEVEAPDGSMFLVSMPTKFRRIIWVKRGGYVVVQPIKEGVKVKGEICKVLTDEHVRCYKKDGVWPKEFCEKGVKSCGDQEVMGFSSEEGSEEDEDSKEDENSEEDEDSEDEESSRS